MADELKIRVHDWRQVEAELLRRGATFREERHIVDTYFRQATPTEVLKIQQDQRGHWLVELKPHDGKFAIVKFDPISDPARLHAELTERFGVKSVLRKICRFYDWGAYVIDFNLIEDVGDFLVLTGEEPRPELLAELGIDNPEYIRVPFDELPRLRTS
jgi:adenylate cyclase class IV